MPESVSVAWLAEQATIAERAVSKLRVIVSTLQAGGVEGIDVSRVPSLKRGSSGLKAFVESAWKSYETLAESGALSPDAIGGHAKTTQGTEIKDLRADKSDLQFRPK